MHQKKELILLAINVFFSLFFFWYAASRLGWPNAWLSIINLIAIAMLWSALLTISLGFSRGLTVFILSLVVSCLVALIGRWRLEAIGSAIITFLIIVSAWVRLNADLNRRLKYSTMHTFGPAAKIIITGSVIIVAGLLLPQIAANLDYNRLITAERISPFIPAIQPVLESTIGRASLGQTTPTLPLEATGAQTLSATESLRPYLNNNNLSSMLASIINNQTRTFLQNNPLLAVLLAMFSLLIVARFLLPILIVPVVIIMAGFIYLSRQLNFIYLSQVEEMVDRLSLSGE